MKRTPRRCKWCGHWFLFSDSLYACREHQDVEAIYQELTR